LPRFKNKSFSLKIVDPMIIEITKDRPALDSLSVRPVASHFESNSPARTPETAPSKPFSRNHGTILKQTAFIEAA